MKHKEDLVVNVAFKAKKTNYNHKMRRQGHSMAVLIVHFWFSPIGTIAKEI